MRLKIHIRKGKGLQPWYFRAVSSNGQTVAASEGYLTKGNAKRAAKKVFGQTVEIVDDSKL